VRNVNPKSKTYYLHSKGWVSEGDVLVSSFIPSHLLVKIVHWLLLFVAIIIFHELGHIIVYRCCSEKDIEVKWEDGGIVIIDDDELNPRQEFFVLWGGIILGFVPLLFYMDLNLSGSVENTGLMIAYLVSCVSDFKYIFKATRKIGREHEKKVGQ